MKYFSIILLIYILASSCKSAMIKEDVYSMALRQIESSAIVINHAYSFKNKNPNFYVLDKRIPINLISLETAIIRQDYIENFQPLRDFNAYELSIINKVNDSIRQKEKTLNRDYSTGLKSPAENTEINPKHNFVVQFSNIVDGNLYALVIPFDNAKQSLKYDTLNYGTGFSFLFHLDSQNQINKIYSTEVYMN